MDDRERTTGAADVPYIAFESAMARMERANKRLAALMVLLLVLLLGTNAVWLWYESQWEDVQIEQEVETGEAPAVVSGMGDAIYGEN